MLHLCNCFGFFIFHIWVAHLLFLVHNVFSDEYSLSICPLPFDLISIIVISISQFVLIFLQHVTKQAPDSTLSLNYNSLLQKRLMQESLMLTIQYLFQVILFSVFNSLFSSCNTSAFGYQFSHDTRFTNFDAIIDNR